MEQIRFFLDEHIPSAVAQGLRRRGIDVLTTQEAGRAGLSDREQLSFALAELRVIVTMDSDFLILAGQGVPHAGIAYTQHFSAGSAITQKKESPRSGRQKYATPPLPSAESARQSRANASPIRLSDLLFNLHDEVCAETKRKP